MFVIVCVMAGRQEIQDSNLKILSITKNRNMTFKLKNKTVIEEVLLTFN